MGSLDVGESLSSTAHPLRAFVNRRPLWLFISITLLLILAALLPNWSMLTGQPLLERSDHAANALSIMRAWHFQELYGNYSRWEFNHPGPAFFYLYAWGGHLFYNVLHVMPSPYQAHVLTGIILQSAFIGAAIAIAASLVGESVVALVCLLCAAVIFPRAGDVIVSIWPPFVLFGPFALLLVSAAGLSLGRVRLLPVAILAGCFLCHGHVVMPAFVLPIMLVSCFWAFVHLRKSGMPIKEMWRRYCAQVVASLVLIALFLVPIVIDLTKCPDCNAHRILTYLHSDHGPMPNWRQAINYIFFFFSFDHGTYAIGGMPNISVVSARVVVPLLCLIATGIFLAWICRGSKVSQPVSPSATSALSRAPSRLFLRMFVFCSLALLLSLVWARNMAGGLHDFEAHFVYAIYYVYACAILSAVVWWAARRIDRMPIAALVFVAAILVFAFSPPLKSGPLMVPDYPDAETSHSLQPQRQGVLFDIEVHDSWAEVVSAAVWVERDGHEFWVPPQWGFMFGRSNGWRQGDFARRSQDVEIWSAIGPQLPPHTLSTKDFCIARINPDPLSSDLLKALNPLRRQCTIATYGFAPIGDDGWTWTIAPEAAIQFRSRKTAQPVALSLQVAPLVPPAQGVAPRRVALWINGTMFGAWTLADAQTLKVGVPAAIWNRSDVATLALELPDATAAPTAKSTNDPQALALRVVSLEVHYQDVR